MNKTELCRPTFDEYFLMLAFVASTRSEDEFIKHGAVIVDNKSKHVLGTGYNATFKRSNKANIPTSNRDARRPWMIHAEENAIMNCTRHPSLNPEGTTIYITGIPCVICLQKIVNFDITDICIANRMGSITENEESCGMRQEILETSKIRLKYIDVTNPWIQRVNFDN